MKTKAVIVNTPGPPESMQWDYVDVPAPANGHVTIKHSYIGINYIDTYHRSGLYPLPLPTTIGMEGAGQVVGIGENTNNTYFPTQLFYLCTYIDGQK